MADEFSRAEKAALLAMRREDPVPKWALDEGVLERLFMRGLLEREGLTRAGVKHADEISAALHGLNAMIAKPHKRDTAYERGRSWTR